MCKKERQTSNSSNDFTIDIPGEIIYVDWKKESYVDWTKWRNRISIETERIETMGRLLFNIRGYFGRHALRQHETWASRRLPSKRKDKGV